MEEKINAADNLKIYQPDHTIIWFQGIFKRSYSGITFQYFALVFIYWKCYLFWVNLFKNTILLILERKAEGLRDLNVNDERESLIDIEPGNLGNPSMGPDQESNQGLLVHHKSTLNCWATSVRLTIVFYQL